MVTAIAGLEEGIITPSTKILDKGAYTYYPGTPPKCWIYRQHGTTHGLVNVSEAIKVSCNYFFFDVGRRLGIDRLVDYATRFGLGEKTGIELTERSGVMASREYTESLGQKWYDGNTLSVAIGQENSAFTPSSWPTISPPWSTGGTRYSAHLLKGGQIQRLLPGALHLRTGGAGLHRHPAGESGCGESGDAGPDHREGALWPAISRTFLSRWGAKTGSAQVGSADKEADAVFTLFAPYDDPEIVISIVVEGGASGGNLAQAAGEIVNYYFSAEHTVESVDAENTLLR